MPSSGPLPLLSRLATAAYIVVLRKSAIWHGKHEKMKMRYDKETGVTRLRLKCIDDASSLSWAGPNGSALVWLFVASVLAWGKYISWRDYLERWRRDYTMSTLYNQTYPSVMPSQRQSSGMLP